MRITFTARHFKPSEQLKEHAQNEVAVLKKYYDGILDVEVILDFIKNKQQQLAEIVVKVNGTKLTGEANSEDMYKSITLAAEKLERQIIKFKEKIRHFENERIVENIQVEEDDELDYPE